MSGKGRYLLLVAVFAAAAILVKLFDFPGYAQSKDFNIFDRFPVQVGDWEGNRAVLEEKVYRILETDMVFVSRFVKGKEAVTLSMVYYPQLKVEFHKPEYCNTGQGDIVELLGTRKVAVRSGESSVPVSINVFLVRRNNGQQDLFYYLYKTGNHLEGNYFWMRYKMAKQYIRDRKADAALIILSTQNFSDRETASATMDGFLRQLSPILQKYL
jgi:EpsI family protein